MAITASEARRNLFGLLVQVNDDAEAVEIINRNGMKAHLVPDLEYRSLMELAHLCRSPHNAMRLFASLVELQEGARGEVHELVDAEDSAAS